MLTISEFMLLIWVLVGIPKEIIQIHKALPHGWINKLSRHFSCIWNINDLLCISVLLLAYMMRLIARCMALADGEDDSPGKGTNSFSRACFAIGFVLYCLRMTQFLRLREHIGPKVTMIMRMSKELYFFWGLLLVLMVMYSVSSESLVHPDKMKFKGSTVFNLFQRSYRNMFGEFEFGEIQEDLQAGYCLLEQEANRTAKNSNDKTVCVDDPANNLTQNYFCDEHLTCKWNARLVFVLLCGFIMFSNVLVINLLIAVFTSVYEKSKSKAEVISRRNELDTLREVKSYPAGPPITGLLRHLYKLIMTLRRCSARHDDYQTNLSGISILVVKLGQLEAALLKGHLKKAEAREDSDTKSMLAQLLDNKDATSQGCYNKGYVPMECNNTNEDPIKGAKWNEGERASLGEPYKVVLYGRPINPWGITGVSGRGELKRWGPNFYTLPIITRYADIDMVNLPIPTSSNPAVKVTSRPI